MIESEMHMLVRKSNIDERKNRQLSRRDFLRQSVAFSAVSIADGSFLSSDRPEFGSGCAVRDKPNFLFIAVDDLRMAAMGAYGTTQVKTPNLDRLAADAMVFERAYCQYPICMPSRASLMTSMRTVGNRADRGPSKDAVTLGQHFKDNGYTAVGNGKIYHTVADSADSWSQPPWRVYDYEVDTEGDWGKYHFDKIWLDPKSRNHISGQGRGPYWESADVNDDAYEDGKIVQRSLEDMRRLSRKGQPFFLAVGLHRPHLPFNAPKRYYDLYDPDVIDPADNRFPIVNQPGSLSNSSEITQYAKIEGWPADEAFHRQARHAYFACVSYVDALIGKLIDELKVLGIYDNTVIVLWSDHGWLLGEHNFWGKHNTLNESLQVPLIVRAPGHKKGMSTDAMVELVDIYPTLCELAGLPFPESHEKEGKSFVPLLDDPEKPWKEAVFSRWQNARAVKTERYLYTEWADGTKMLFDHKKDPRENVNIAEMPESAAIAAQMSALLYRK
jgi:arylsulfatase A-like enzyme